MLWDCKQSNFLQERGDFLQRRSCQTEWRAASTTTCHWREDDPGHEQTNRTMEKQKELRPSYYIYSVYYLKNRCKTPKKNHKPKSIYLRLLENKGNKTQNIKSITFQLHKKEHEQKKQTVVCGTCVLCVSQSWCLVRPGAHCCDLRSPAVPPPPSVRNYTGIKHTRGHTERSKSHTTLQNLPSRALPPHRHSHRRTEL